MHRADLSTELTAFLQGEVDAAAFRHADHVRTAFELLRRHDFLESAISYTAALKTIAARAGHPGAYHETMTLAFLSLIGERMAGRDHDTFAAFAAANPDLLEKSLLRRWHGADRLASSVARSTFILPEPARL